MQDVVVIVCYLIDTKNKGTKLLMNYADPRVIFSGVLTPPIKPSNPKQFWKIAKLLNKNSSLVKNGYTATTNADKATMLKGFFSMFQHCSTTIVDKPGGTFELLRYFLTSGSSPQLFQFQKAVTIQILQIIDPSSFYQSLVSCLSVMSSYCMRTC